MGGNLYVHFPFCRRKCSYCALYSRVGVSLTDRETYVRRLGKDIAALLSPSDVLGTVYFGGGTPALCDLRPLSEVLRPHCGPKTEFTVELHPLDVTEEKLDELVSLGVNRLSVGVQSLDDATLAAMGRGYSVEAAERAFRLARSRFDNVGIDLIVGYPGDPCIGWERLAGWGLRHCSVYSLQNERGLENVPDDDVVLDRIREVADCLRSLGLERYEISNYALPGYECRHNLAVWCGEDYWGVGDGAYGRVGRTRTPSGEVVSPERDVRERTLFRLRTRKGLDASHFPAWERTLVSYVEEGLLTRENDIYRLTERGTEVCDSILADLV